MRQLHSKAVLTIAVACASLPLNPSALAQGTTEAPKRIIFYFTGNGFPPNHWRCDVPGEVTAAELRGVLTKTAL